MTEKTIFRSLVVCEEKKFRDGDNRRLHRTIGGLERVDGRCVIEILGIRNQSADGVKSTRNACSAIDGRRSMQRDLREKKPASRSTGEGREESTVKSMRDTCSTIDGRRIEGLTAYFRDNSVSCVRTGFIV